MPINTIHLNFLLNNIPKIPGRGAVLDTGKLYRVGPVITDSTETNFTTLLQKINKIITCNSHDMWHLTRDMWHMEGGEHSHKILCP